MGNQLGKDPTKEELQCYLRTNNKMNFNQLNALNNDSTFAFYTTTSQQRANNSSNNIPAATTPVALTPNNYPQGIYHDYSNKPASHRHSFPGLNLDKNTTIANFPSSPINPPPVASPQHQQNYYRQVPWSYQLQQSGDYLNGFTSSPGIQQTYTPPHPLSGFLDLKPQQQFFSNNTNGVIQQLTSYERRASYPTAIPSHEQQQFPTSFDPRAASNMPHKEKVNNWISKLPIYCLANGEIWHSECYPGVIPASSSINSSSESYEGLDFLQYNQQEVNYPNQSQLYVDHEDILEFQARKITKYVKKLYQLDQSEQVAKGDYDEDDDELDENEVEEVDERSYVPELHEHGLLDCGVNPDKSGHNYSFGAVNESANLEITNTSYNLKLTEVFDQINNKVNNQNILEDIDKFVAPNPRFNTNDGFEDMRYISNKTTTLGKMGPYSKM